MPGYIKVHLYGVYNLYEDATYRTEDDKVKHVSRQITHYNTADLKIEAELSAEDDTVLMATYDELFSWIISYSWFVLSHKREEELSIVEA